MFFIVHVWDIFYIAEQFSLLNIEDLGRPALGLQMEISSLVIIFTFNMFVTLMSINTRCSCWIDLIIFFFKTTDNLCYHFMFPFLNTFMLFSFHSASFFWNHSWVFKEKQVSRRDLGFFPPLNFRVTDLAKHGGSLEKLWHRSNGLSVHDCPPPAPNHPAPASPPPPPPCVSPVVMRSGWPAVSTRWPWESSLTGADNQSEADGRLQRWNEWSNWSGRRAVCERACEPVIQY